MLPTPFVHQEMETNILTKQMEWGTNVTLKETEHLCIVISNILTFYLLWVLFVQLIKL